MDATTNVSHGWAGVILTATWFMKTVSFWILDVDAVMLYTAGMTLPLAHLSNKLSFVFI